MVCDVLRELVADVRPVAEEDGTECVDGARYFTPFFEHEVVCQGDDDGQYLVLAFVALEVLDWVSVDAQTLQLSEEHLEHRTAACVLLRFNLFEVLDHDTVVFRVQFESLAVHHAHHRLN